MEKKSSYIFIFLVLFLGGINPLYAQPINDNKAGAITIVHSANNCSANAAYTTQGGTADGVKGSCWENGPNYTVWFKFVATSTGVTLDLKTGGVEGTIQHPNIALWDTDGATELSCSRRIDATTDIQMSYTGLTIGLVYYVTVDNYVGSWFLGTFTLCIDTSVSNDFKVGATTLIHSANNCSANAAYTTQGGTADGTKGSCWENGPNYTRWFKFVATSTGVTLDLKTGGVEGTIQHPNIALWDTDGATELACVKRVDATTDIQVSYIGLVIGLTYYVTVDNYVGSWFMGTFTLCIDTSVSNDFKAGATTLIHSANNCSANAAYTTQGGTADGTKGSCWENGPNYTRWFKFVATSTGVTLDLKTGGVEGTIQHPNMALWNADGTTELSCSRRIDATTDIQMSYTGLTIGLVYYVTVDNYLGSWLMGTFTLCIDTSVSNDFKVGATTLIHSANNCSANAAYTTQGGTADGTKGSCWENGPNYTRWFKFVATSADVTLDLKTGGVEGTIQHPNIALWDADGVTELACVKRVDATTDIQVSYTGLIIGLTYYVTVDNYVGSWFMGTFTLCIDNKLTFDYKSGAILLPNTSNWCSADAAYTSSSGTSDGASTTCGNNPPLANVWFKFIATTSVVTVKVKTNGVSGTLAKPVLSLWEGATQLGCMSNSCTAPDSVELSYYGLTPGNTYHISVDYYCGGNPGSFTLCVDDALTYDYFSGAKDLPSISNYCSANKEYSTASATTDGPATTCGGTPSSNVWFKFVATTSAVTIDVKTSGVLGTLYKPVIALWDLSQTEITCKSNSCTGPSVVELSYIGLTVGNTYYISVDHYCGGSGGSFTLCVNDQPSFDFVEGAVVLANVDNYVSADAEYSNAHATSSGTTSSCNTSSNDVWFKFKAICNAVTVSLNTTGTKGTIYKPTMALWDAGFSEIGCVTSGCLSSAFTTFTTGGLVVGNWYYISVDVYCTGGTGSFSLSVDNSSLNFYSVANGDWSNPAVWAATSGGVGGVGVPGACEIAHIENNSVTVTANQTIGLIYVEPTTANTSLSINGGMLTVDGSLLMNNTGSNFDNAIVVSGGGNLTIGSDAIFTRNGGANLFKLDLQTGSSMSVGNNMEWRSLGGITTNTEMFLSGTASLTVSNNLILAHTGGSKIRHLISGSSVINISKNIDFTAVSSAASVEMVFSGTAQINLGRSILRSNTPSAFGALNMQTGTTLQLNGVSTQHLAANLGSSGDAIIYSNVIINNTSSVAPQIITDGNIIINNNLTLTDGIVEVPNVNSIAFIDNATITGGSITSFIDGAVKKIGNDAFSFPVGDYITNRYSPVVISAPINISDEFIAKYHNADVGSVPYSPLSIDVSLNHISRSEYWTLDRTNGSSNVSVSVGWDANSGGITNLTDLRVAGWDGATWKDYGNGAISGTTTVGQIVSGVPALTYGPFTLASSTIENPLSVPVNDDYSNAIDITPLLGNCSVNAAFTNINGTADKNAGSCSAMGIPLSNVWFKVQAPVTGVIQVTLKTGTSFGTLQNAKVTLWQSDGVTEIACGAGVSFSPVSLETTIAIPSHWYYISVDVPIINDEGTFSLCLANSLTYTWTGVTSTDWGTASNWDKGVVPPATVSIVIAAAVNNPILDINRTIYDLTIESGAILDVNNLQLSLATNFTNSGTILTPGELIFNGTTAQTITGATVFDKLTINNPSGVSVVSGIQQLTGVLTVSAGIFATNNLLTVVSNASGTGSIGAVGGSITGNVTVQRYFSMAADGWVSLASPVNGQTLVNWNDDIVTTGFTGADYPAAVYNWVNIYTYAEPTLGNFDQGYLTATNIANTVPVGKGYLNYILAGNKTVDVTGTIHTGNFNFGISYTDDIAQPALDDGWNLIGNPYVSTIDWDAVGWTKTNVNDAIYVWDDNVQQFASYVNGIGTNNGSRYIPSSQSFWVQTNAVSPVLIVSESCKSAIDAAFHARTSFDMLKIQLAGSSSFTDETILLFDPISTSNYDPALDAHKLRSQNPTTPNVSMLTSANENLSINTLPRKSLGNEIPLLVTVGVTGTYTLTFPTNSLGEPLLYLKDLQTGSVTDLNATPTYTFTIDNTITEPRFRLFIGKTPTAVLPIELLSFHAILNKDRVELTWATATEINNNYFEVEKSKDGKTWKAILEVEGAGNSAQLIEYFDVDYKPYKGTSYYRLKQVDFDGKYSYSTMAIVTNNGNKKTELIVYPNPSDGDNLNLVIPAESGEEILVVLRDVQGREVYTKLIKTNNSTYKISLTDGVPLAKGVYLITATSDQAVFSRRLVVK